MQTVPAKVMVTRNKSTAWFGCEYNMNLYRGCCHGCLYCDSRSDCYRNADFDTVKVKENALALLRDNLARKAKRGVVATGAMSDPYNLFEESERLTRHALQLLDAYQFGVAIATKSDLITRDIDILSDIRQHSPVLCKITVTTPHDALAAKIEPRAPSSTARLAAVEKLAAAGLFAGVLLMPVLPFLCDDEPSVRLLVHRCRDAGARFVYPSFGVTQRGGQREYFHAGLQAAFPEQNLAQRYRARYGGGYYCASPQAPRLWQAFTETARESGLLYDMREIVRAYRQGRQAGQLSFL